ncbi:MAG: outer membrane protein transport protein [Deltaproteobacteria bacterium]|nr:outer membrane protein transport protein [Deltaproteobacteria bacterium]
MRTGKVLSILLVLVFSATSAMAAGFRLPEAGAKAMGMGFAFTAQANDPSAIYFNPAGITQLPGKNVMLGVTYIRENGGEFNGITPLSGGATITETQKDLDFWVPNAYYTQQGSGALTWGIGIFTPFGLGQEYKDRNTSYFRNQVTKIDLQTFVVNPTLAWKVNDVLSLGAGIDFMYGKAKLAKTGVINNAVPPGDSPTNIFLLDLEGDGTAWGYNFGLLLTPSPNWKIGVSHRSPFSLDIKDGDVELTNISSTPLIALGGASAQTVFGGASFSTKGSTTIHMPATTAFGIAYVRDRLTLEADIDWTWWHSYDSLNIDIKNNTALLPDSNTAKNWKDVAALRIGAEYRVTDPLALRLGFAYDPSPVPASTMGPELPDATRLNYMLGAGYKYRNWTFDGSYFYVDKKDRTVNNQTTPAFPSYGTGFNGTWKGSAHLVALDIGYRF